MKGEVSTDAQLATDAFALFYANNRVPMIQLAWLLTRDADTAEDVVHEAFSAVYPRFGSLDRPGAYLRRSVVNGVYQRSRRRKCEHDRLRTAAATAERHVPAPTGGLADVVAVLETRARTAVVLRYWAGLNDREIAEAMQIKPATARPILSRALKRLRQEIE